MFSRDIRLDTMRGLLLVIMTLNHLGGGLPEFTSQPFGFVSAAEGFILLSAYTFAITLRLDSVPASSISQIARKRSWKIYKYQIFLVAILLLIELVLPVYGEYWGTRFHADDGSLIRTVFGNLFLIHQPMYFDILPMYIVFSLLSPLVLTALRANKGPLVLACSGLIWLLGHYVNPLKIAAVSSGMSEMNGFFNVLSWQLLWVIGLYIGFLHRHQQRSEIMRGGKVVVAAMGIATVCFLLRHELLEMPSEAHLHFNIVNLGVLRLLNVGAQLILFLNIIHLVKRDIGLPWFRFIGRYSLQVFTFHVFIIYMLMPFGWRIIEKFGLPGIVTYNVAVAASVVLPALVYRRYFERTGRSKAAATTV